MRPEKIKPHRQRSRSTRAALLVLMLMPLSGCDWLKSPAKADQPQQRLASDFTPQQPEQLTQAQRAQLERGKAAQAALATTLLSTVTDAIKTQGPAQAIEVCAQKAPLLAQEAAKAHNLRIGRTSFKLRQPNNGAPDWAQDMVKTRHDKQAILTHEDGRMAILSPIRIMEPCLKCHGDDQALAPGVKEALAMRYPSDQATGFKAGDLRGWFWIEVPATPTAQTP